MKCIRNNSKIKRFNKKIWCRNWKKEKNELLKNNISIYNYEINNIKNEIKEFKKTLKIRKIIFNNNLKNKANGIII